MVAVECKIEHIMGITLIDTFCFLQIKILVLLIKSQYRQFSLFTDLNTWLDFLIKTTAIYDYYWLYGELKYTISVKDPYIFTIWDRFFFLYL